MILEHMLQDSRLLNSKIVMLASSVFQGTVKSFWSKILDPKHLNYKTLTIVTN